MTNPIIEITTPGFFTTIQDQGRYGYQRLGVPVSGAMDIPAHKLANRLVGNDLNSAVLEMTMVGPELRFLSDTWVAITGADMKVTLNGHPLPTWESVKIANGSRLVFGTTEHGMRTYLSIIGGIDVPMIMGSRSTYVQGAFGGLEGRALVTGDVLSGFNKDDTPPFTPWCLPEEFRPLISSGHQGVRVVLGPQHANFTSEAINTFLKSTYMISLDSDRMGYRLEGPSLSHRDGPDIVSDGNPPGAIQVPGEGTPTILMADRGTTGGYAKIATVITADLGILAQRKPGQSISFFPVTISEANKALRKSLAVLDRIEELKPTPLTKMSISVGGKTFGVEDQNGRMISEPDVITTPSNIITHHVKTSSSHKKFEFEVEVRRER